MKGAPNIALVQDALPTRGGAERVLEAVLELFPHAPIYTLIYRPEAFVTSKIQETTIHTSFLNRIPGLRLWHRSLLPFMPFAVEQLDVSGYEIILSFSYAVAHGVLARPDQLHLSYTFTPLRHAWHAYQQFLETNVSIIGNLPTRLILHYFRQWDVIASNRVDDFIAPSQWIAECIRRAYRRQATVIYPPVNLDESTLETQRGDYFVTVSRLEPHKKIDLIVQAFNQLGLPLILIGDGREFGYIRKLAQPNILLLGHQSDEVIREVLRKARGYIHAAEDDFGITPVEAQAAGCPVIAYAKGGVLETVIEGKTGFFYPQRDVDSLVAAVKRFEREYQNLSGETIRKNAQRFGKQRFQHEFAQFVEAKWSEFRKYSNFIQP
jgi:glycosyltransferase involved in cell wall biosynthesis